MANQEHLDILKQGAEDWNQWRKEKLDIRPDLSYADLSYANLSHAKLISANLGYVILSDANLSDANLSDADLYRADLRYANLSSTNLSDADLRGANLSYANLRYANLSSTDLYRAIISGADLTEANLTAAILEWTIFGDVNLSRVKGLDTIRHHGPSTIGIDTIYSSQANIPEAFLRGAGAPNSFIDYMRSLVDKPIDYYSCFISYSGKDQAFAERIYADLQSKGVRCWFAQEDMKIGDKIRPHIEESIRLYDKLLIVLSEHSIASNWVAYEVERALNKEPQGIPNVLFPIRLDDAVMNSKASWADDIKSTRYIGDFTRWKDHDEYQKVFDRLLRDLQAQ